PSMPAVPSTNCCPRLSTASRVGISAAALYRHYSSKYELFRDAVLNLGQQLVDGTAGIEGDDPHVVLDELVSA
ncbi:hypothetical protein C6A85_04090, partial [Mycobacterium sp. ITM-2017-0098]